MKAPSTRREHNEPLGSDYACADDREMKPRTSRKMLKRSKRSREAVDEKESRRTLRNSRRPGANPGLGQQTRHSEFEDPWSAEER